MRITIDRDAATLTMEGNGVARTHPLFGEDAFRILSREWLAIGWNLGHWQTLSWMGRQILQLPGDVLRLAEAVWRVQPAVIVETGVFDGGSAFLFATLCRMRRRGRVIAIDNELRPSVREAAERECLPITFVETDSASPSTAAIIRGLIGGGESVFVFLDSDHLARHVAAELENYAALVTPGSYVVVADTNLAHLSQTPNGDPRWKDDNPAKAVDDFLARHPEFVQEPPRPLHGASEAFQELSYFAAGWLLRR